jgi:hypothetical protein
MKIAATLSKCIQTSSDGYTTFWDTKIFDTSCTFDEIIQWYKAKHGPSTKFHISDVQFSMVEETE